LPRHGGHRTEGHAYASPKGAAATRRESDTALRATPSVGDSPNLPLQLPCRPIPRHRGRGTTAPRAAPRRRLLPSMRRTNAGVRRQPPCHATMRPADGGLAATPSGEEGGWGGGSWG
jgi:hypothetical protein